MCRTEGSEDDRIFTFHTFSYLSVIRTDIETDVLLLDLYTWITYKYINNVLLKILFIYNAQLYL